MQLSQPHVIVRVIDTKILGGILEHTFSPAVLRRAFPSAACQGNSVVGSWDPVLTVGPSLCSHASSCSHTGYRGASQPPRELGNSPKGMPAP